MVSGLLSKNKILLRYFGIILVPFGKISWEKFLAKQCSQTSSPYEKLILFKLMKDSKPLVPGFYLAFKLMALTFEFL